MRKWMRERMQRRKKTPAEASDQPAPPPLQPAYFDAEQAAGAAPEGAKIESDIPAPPPPPEARPGRRVRQAFAPAAVKGSIPAGPVEDEDELPDTGDAEAQAPTPPVVAAAPQAPAIPAPAQRPPKGVVVLAIGLPGSGKSSWFKRHNIVPLSSDMVRTLLFDDVREQRFQDLVFSNLRSMLKGRLIAKRPMNYVDATNLTPQERQHWIKLAKDYQYEVHAVFFDVPLEVCIERHQRRDRVVPEDVMRRMAAKLKPPAFEEGIAKITVVRVKKKEPEAS